MADVGRNFGERVVLDDTETSANHVSWNDKKRGQRLRKFPI
jgi:hypothetical protein